MKKKSALLVVTITLMATLLTACSKDQLAASTSEAETESTAEEAVPAENAEGEETAEAAEPEPTAEPTPEPTPEAVVYEGIDMQSTLPGEEWIKTFNGIINEPKLVVFNDETNKKVIVESGEKVEFSQLDTMAVYVPKEKTGTIKELDLFTFSKKDNDGYVFLFNDIMSKPGEETNIKNIVEYDGKDYELTATLVVTE